MRCILGSPALNFASEHFRVMQSTANCKASCKELVVRAESFTLSDKAHTNFFVTAITFGAMDVKSQMLFRQTITNKYLFIEKLSL